MSMYFVEADLSQVEDRIVKMLTRQPDLIKQAQSKPWEFDTHTHNARQIFSVIERCKPDEVEVTKEKRTLGKKARHAGNYGMGEERMSDELLKEGYIMPPSECRSLLDASFHGINAAILEWQKETRVRLVTEGVLTNSWGRILAFEAGQLNEDAYRKAYAFVPQSDAVDLLNQWGLIPFHTFIREERLRTRINAQIHDAILFSAPAHEIHKCMKFLQRSIERPRTYYNNELIVPVTFKMGKAWGEGIEFKKLPTTKQLKEVL